MMLWLLIPGQARSWADNNSMVIDLQLDDGIIDV